MNIIQVKYNKNWIEIKHNKTAQIESLFFRIILNIWIFNSPQLKLMQTWNKWIGPTKTNITFEVNSKQVTNYKNI